MGLASGERRRDNHIRSISWLFLGDSRPPLPQPAARTAGCRLWGEPGSPWPLALAANLALAAWRRGESVGLELPAARLAPLARLLGAPPAGLGLAWREERAAARLEPLPGLFLVASGTGLAPVDCHWRFTLDEERLPLPILSPILALLERSDSALPPAAGAPLFLLGLECTPAPRQGVTGVWGPLARHQLLDPARGGEPALRAGEGAVRRRYSGFLEALRSLPAPGRREERW